ncbi:MAG: hypothetical protein JRE70_14515, partial [Deltaproteobacteria bacterium]|nr:hypothetical protein [Deltaproteobacteria bacterium]
MSESTQSTAGAVPKQTGEQSWSVLELVRWTTDHFRGKGIESARLDAECLLAHTLGLRRLD